MAEAISDGELLKEVAQKFAVGCTTVREACLEWGVYPPRYSASLPTSGFAILYHLLQGEKQIDIAKRLHITRQRVNNIAIEARKAGFVIPGNKRKR